VVPSVRIAEDFEGLSVVILEAMAVGLPVLATDAGGFSDVILHQDTGEIVPNGNTDALKEAILRLIEAPKQLEVYAKNGRKLVLSSFTYEALTRLYSKLL